MSHCRRSLFPSTILVLLAVPAVYAQMLSPIPGYLLDVAGQFPMPDEFSFEQQIQAGTQGNSSNGNPFGYWHGVQIRPWFHYDGLRNTTLTASASYIDYFGVPGTSNYSHPEWRVTALGTLKQHLSGGSVYEQCRFELLNFRDSHGVTQHLPRVRVRFGQDLYLGEGNSRPYLGVYEEAIVQFPKSSYSHVNFEGARFFAGYGFEWGARTHVLLGFKAEGEVSTSGSTVTLYYGPAVSIEYTFSSHPMNEKHKRTTAFKDF
jgi:hypothetical protein